MPQRGPLTFLIVALIVLLPFVFLIAKPFLTSFILAAIIAVVVNPVKDRLEAKIHRPGLASFLTTFTTVLVLVTVVGALGFVLSQELVAAYNSLNQRSLEEGGWPALAASTLDRIFDAISSHVPIDREAIRERLVNAMASAASYVVSNIGAVFGGLADVIITVLLVTLFLYFLLKYGETWLARLVDFTPLESRTTSHILLTMRNSVIANVTGVFAVAAAQGALLILAFWIVDLRSPVLWGVIGGLASIIPLLGAPLVWVPVAVGLLIAGSYWKALFLGIWGMLVVGSVDNVLRSFVVGARDRQHPMIVALSAIGGAYAFGALGILLGPLVVSLLAALIKEIQHLAARPAA